jgi:hypothetical protein
LDVLWRLLEENNVAYSGLCESLPYYFDARLDTREDSCFIAECFRRLKAKQQLGTALRASILRQEQDARLRSFGCGTISKPSC